jgi:hypothetical protein
MLHCELTYCTVNLQVQVPLVLLSIDVSSSLFDHTHSQRPQSGAA